MLVAFAACALIYTSCKNKCGSTTCQNGSTCDNNVCICPIGYSGNACQTGWSDAAVGTYTCSRGHCSPAVSGVSNWQSTITKDATNSGYTLDINNFNNSNTTVVATIDSAQSTSQRVTISGSNGTGTDATGYLTISTTATTINLTYTTYTGGIAGATCQMVMTKE